MNVRVEKKEGCVKTRNGIHMNPLSYDSNRFISDQGEISPYPPSSSRSVDLKVTRRTKKMVIVTRTMMRMTTTTLSTDYLSDIEFHGRFETNKNRDDRHIYIRVTKIISAYPLEITGTRKRERKREKVTFPSRTILSTDRPTRVPTKTNIGISVRR